jgi:hypothetical protein
MNTLGFLLHEKGTGSVSGGEYILPIATPQVYFFGSYYYYYYYYYYYCYYYYYYYCMLVFVFVSAGFDTKLGCCCVSSCELICHTKSVLLTVTTNYYCYYW